LDRLTAPPYDVISESDQQGLRARSPYNIVHVDRTEAAGNDGASGYAIAGSLLADWRASGVLRPSVDPSYYGYELRYRLDGIATGSAGSSAPWSWSRGAETCCRTNTRCPVRSRDRLRYSVRRGRTCRRYGTVSGPCGRLNELLDGMVDGVDRERPRPRRGRTPDVGDATVKRM
jgi:hypothetical protein